MRIRRIHLRGYLEREHVLAQVVTILEDDGVLLPAPQLICQWIHLCGYLECENVLAQVVAILDDGVLLVAPNLVRQRIRILPYLRENGYVIKGQ